MRRLCARIGCAIFAVAALTRLSSSARAQGNAASLYNARCAVCHAADGTGNTTAGRKLGARDFASPEVQKETDQELIEITAKGKNKMPAYGNSLKDSQIKELVAYIRELGKKR
ncbi:MAG: cytochrome c [Candidatus Acidiferrales bacterium]